MPMKTIDRGDFWEFKARCAEVDLEIAKLRVAGELLAARKNTLVEQFAHRFDFDPALPIHLDDVRLTAAQEE